MTGDLPSGEIPGSQATEVPEDLPSGKRSRTEAKGEDVEMEDVREEEEEVPQDEQMEEADYDDESEDSLPEEAMMRAHEIVNYTRRRSN